MATVINEEKLNWLVKYCNNFNCYRDLTIAFNNAFNCNVCYNTIKATMNKLGFRKSQKYTKEQNEWLINNINNYSRKELTELFNKTFSCNKTEGALKKHCNNELKIYFKTNNERYRKNQQLQQKKENVGSIRHTKKGTYIKATDDINKQKWVLLTRYVNGLANKDNRKFVIIIDKNKPITKENTMIVDKSVMAILCKNKYFSLSPELKKLAILTSIHKNEIRKLKNKW